MQHDHPSRPSSNNPALPREWRAVPSRFRLSNFAIVLAALSAMSAVHGSAPASAIEPQRTELQRSEWGIPGLVPRAELEARRAALAAAIGDGVIWIEARGDAESPVTRNFFYLTGLETAGASLLIECSGGKGSETLFLPARSKSWELWHGSRAFPGPAASERTGVTEIAPVADLRSRFEQAIAEGKALYYLPTQTPRAEVESADAQWIADVRARAPQLDPIESVEESLAILRQVKGPDELHRLRRAVAITEKAFEAAFATLAPGGTEYQIEAAIEGTFRRLGGAGPGFPSIIGAGANSCILHYQENNGPVAEGDLIVIDVGASWGGYTADITRTVPANGVYSERQREIYAIVARAQAAGIAAARPGATLREIHRAARKVFVEEGLEEFFRHGTSHHVGLEVHDVGSTRRPLEPGMVITVEPGLYLPTESLGIRIEDMIVITEEGCTVLSEAIPRTPDALEAAIERARRSSADEGRATKPRREAL